MNSIAESTQYSSQQTLAWMRGLLALAWADGQFQEEEQQLIASITHDILATDIDVNTLEPISPQELAEVLGPNPILAENFLRTAVMVALADGIYSVCEDDLLHQFCEALGLQVKVLDSLRHTLEDLSEGYCKEPKEPKRPAHHHHHIDVLAPVKHWLDDWQLHDPKVAKFICKMVPPQCPFERDIKLFGHKIVHIPPMCKINPLYEQLVGLRFRALSYLADECHEDISKYC
ncbi:nitrogenase [Arthrospira sp. O9.13F]|uniref:Mo-dependent nitrogenase n=1 Tax=Limnospira indica PCC 8005 TaxID=376219 RepID=A0A9P1KDN4_9CYAN|nr:Mo-dependent nitrogenase C-terminal domain-containing protein [Limnospira indica]RAQ45302.1 nitrogenase [Arthrospira sp. O9.13F]CDM94177.1 putative Mo-dependent nitrogenase [Limnospira indica PCC 8005]